MFPVTSVGYLSLRLIHCKSSTHSLTTKRAQQRIFRAVSQNRFGFITQLHKSNRRYVCEAAKAQEGKDGSLLFRFDQDDDDEKKVIPVLEEVDLTNEESATLEEQSPLTESSSEALGSVHFIGIGGAGLSVLATISVQEGYMVSGSDLNENDRIEKLRSLGASVEVGPHSPDHLLPALSYPGPTAVVVSSAVPSSNPELVKAKEEGVPIFKRDAWLGKITQDKDVLAVAGTHGKTTTSALLALVMREGFGEDLTAVVGADIPQFPGGGGAMYGSSSRHFVLEADEYDNAFLGVKPRVALVTNLEWEHVDCFPDLQSLNTSFQSFVAQIQPGGALVLCGDDPGALALEDYKPEGVEVLTYGLDPSNDFSAVALNPNLEGGTDFVVVSKGAPLGKISSPMAGLHNVLNTLGVIAVAATLESRGTNSSVPSPLTSVPKISVMPSSSVRNPTAALQTNGAQAVVKTVGDVLFNFQGVHRRFQRIAILEKCHIYDDYAHHPTEIVATLQAARQRYDRANLWVVFQPHTYSRLRQFLPDFMHAFDEADRVIVTQVFGARSENLEGDETDMSLSLADSIIGAPTVYIPSIQDAVERIAWELQMSILDRDEPVVIISMGAGDINCFGPRLVDRLG